jgi:hypothetical protein
MWIDRKRQQETEKRKGLSVRTGVVVGVLVSGFIGAYLLTAWLFSSGTMSIDLFYNNLGIPRTISQNTIHIVLVLFIVFALQFLAVIGFAMANPEARKRSGQPSAVAQNPDLYDSLYK